METELRLGLPGDGEAAKNNGCKRGFHETVDLKLIFSSMASEKGGGGEKLEKRNPAVSLPSADPEKPPSKAQVVGWPPVRSFRKNMAVQKKGSGDEEKNGGNTASLVKVSMDGAPYLRKVDLKVYKSYEELSFALSNMFSSFTFDYDFASDWSPGTKDFVNERKLVDLLHNSEYVSTYEDKDGDWMLVGDVPWEMFVDSCERLRIMKGSEAIGIGKLKYCLDLCISAC